MFECVGVFFSTCGFMSLFSFYCLFLSLKKKTARFFLSSNDKKKVLQSQLWKCNKSPFAAFWRAAANQTVPERDSFSSMGVFLCSPVGSSCPLVWAVISRFGSKWPSVAELQRGSLLISRPPLSQRSALIGPLNQRLFICLPWCDATAAISARFFCFTEATSRLFRPWFEF